MSWLVQPRLINDPFSDPGLFLDFRYGRRALLFDLGELTPLASREIMRVSHVFVSHTHMDHFTGFDRILRLCLHREGPLHLVGPPGFIAQVEARLASYTWNLLGPDSPDFRLVVSEFEGNRTASTTILQERTKFAPQPTEIDHLPAGLVLDEPDFSVRAVTLDHGMPCLAFAFQERLRVNVIRGALDERGWPVGPWLNAAKSAVRAGLPEYTTIALPNGSRIPLRELKRDILRAGPGQKVVYVTDAAFTPENAAAIIDLARDADQLFIEAVFLDEDASLAATRMHLTARQAAELALAAGARHVTPFHHSPRYLERPNALAEELDAVLAAGRA